MLILNKLSSRRDKFGNCYHAISVENVETGLTASATISGDNASTGLLELFGDWEAVRQHSRTHERELPIREFDRFKKDLPYAGCRGEDIAAWIVSAVGEPSGMKERATV
jgi:hypothetical protein